MCRSITWMSQSDKRDDPLPVVLGQGEHEVAADALDLAADTQDLLLVQIKVILAQAVQLSFSHAQRRGQLRDGAQFVGMRVDYR